MRPRFSQEVLDPTGRISEVGADRWMVVIFNNETNSIEEVITILMIATGCDQEEAYLETWEAHIYGKAPVHFSSKDECDEVSGIIAGIGVRTEVCKEWPE